MVYAEQDHPVHSITHGLTVASKPHLFAGAIAILFAAVVGIALVGFTRWLEQKTIHAIARITPFGQERVGDSIMGAAFQQDDLLVIYGSSETITYTAVFGANTVFQSYPTGFDVMIDGNANLTSLNIAQSLASMGKNLKGKKVVISFTPTAFFSQGLPDKPNLGNFSRLHALELVYSDSLSMDLKARITRRMLDYPDSFKSDPILLFGAQHLASTQLTDRILYYLSYPLGRFDIAIIHLQDIYEVINFLNKNRALFTGLKRTPSTIPWDQMLEKAKKSAIASSSNNHFGVNNTMWVRDYEHLKALPPGSRDARTLKIMMSSREWEDFDAMLMVLKEEGAEPLILSRPLNGNLYDDLYGVSAKVRNVYYDRMAAEVKKYGFPLVDFREHDLDRYFNGDGASHSSPVGWVYVDRVLNDFYHNTLQEGY